MKGEFWDGVEWSGSGGVGVLQIHSYFSPPLLCMSEPNLTGQISAPRKQATSTQWRLQLQGKKEIGAMRK